MYTGNGGGGLNSKPFPPQYALGSFDSYVISTVSRSGVDGKTGLNDNIAKSY